jgi:hypothetical protein
MSEVMIDGVRYVPATPRGNKVSIWYMHDNHCFSQLEGKTIKDILKEADRIEKESSYGALCPVIVLAGDKELRRVGPMVHSHGKDKKEWEEGKKRWKEVIEKDNEIMEIIGSRL